MVGNLGTLMQISVLLSIVFVLQCRAEDTNHGITDTVVFRHAIDRERQLVVVRGPTIDPNKAASVLSPSVLKDIVGVYHVRLEIHVRDEAPLILWTRVILEPKSESFQGFDVLALLVEPNRIVFATGEYGGISIWALDLLRGNVACKIFNGLDWIEHGGAVSPVNRQNAGVVLSRSADGKTLIAEISEKGREAENRHTIFEQTGEAWEFRSVKSFSSLFRSERNGNQGRVTLSRLPPGNMYQEPNT